jgi:L-fucose mutarotase
MLKTSLLHPDILQAIARAGHGSKVLISDGNFPHATVKGQNAKLVFLNLAPGVVNVTNVLRTLVTVIPIEAAEVMRPNKDGPYAMDKEPSIFKEFQSQLADTDCRGTLQPLERFKFDEASSSPNVCLTIATGEQRIYANLLLTIGVVKSEENT